MDRRTLLAFALMFLVLFGWSAIFGPQPTPPDATDAEPKEEGFPAASIPTSEPVADPVVDTTPPDTAGEGTTGATWGMAGGETGERISVVTDLFAAEIDAVGGDITAWRLNDFSRLEGAAVDLISPFSLDGRNQRSHGLTLLFEDRQVDLRRVQFHPSTTSLRLDGNRPTGDLRLSATAENGAQIQLVYRFDNERYGMEVEASVTTASVTESPTALEISWPGGLASSEPDSSREYAEFKAMAKVGSDVEKKNFRDLKGDGAKGRAGYSGTIGWAGSFGQYFGAIVVAEEARRGTVQFDGDHARNLQTFDVALALDRGQRSTLAYAVYLGPLDPEAVRWITVDPFEAKTNELVDFGPSIFRPVSRVILAILKFLYGIIPNYGLVIVVFSALTKVLFYPLTKSSTQSMRKMQEIQPQLAKLKEKFKDDQQRQSQEMMKLYKENGINPAGGCLPLLVQMPVFIGLFHILRKTIELRQADFAFWMSDLSRPDVLFTMPFSIPIMGDKFCVLPFLMAASMWWQTKVSQSGTPSAGGGMMAQQMKMMSTLMPIMMFVFFYNSPSGLVLYWFVNTVMTAAQTWQIQRKMKKPEVDLAPEPA